MTCSREHERESARRACRRRARPPGAGRGAWPSAQACGPSPVGRCPISQDQSAETPTGERREEQQAAQDRCEQRRLSGAVQHARRTHRSARYRRTRGHRPAALGARARPSPPSAWAATTSAAPAPRPRTRTGTDGRGRRRARRGHHLLRRRRHLRRAPGLARGTARRGARRPPRRRGRRPRSSAWTCAAPTAPTSAPAARAATSCAPSRRRCAGWAPTGSTSTSSTRPTRARRSRRRSPRSTTWSAPARSATSATRTSPAGRSPRPSTSPARSAPSRFVSAQNHYNLLDRGAELEVLPAAGRYGLGVLPYFPLANGLLTGKYAGGTRPGRHPAVPHPRAPARTRRRRPAARVPRSPPPAGSARSRSPSAGCSPVAGGQRDRRRHQPDQVLANAAAGAWVPSRRGPRRAGRDLPAAGPDRLVLS